MFSEYRNVEGVVWVNAENIVKDLQVKENQIKKIKMTVPKERDYSHLR